MKKKLQKKIECELTVHCSQKNFTLELCCSEKLVAWPPVFLLFRETGSWHPALLFREVGCLSPSSAAQRNWLTDLNYSCCSKKLDFWPPALLIRETCCLTSTPPSVYRSWLSHLQFCCSDELVACPLVQRIWLTDLQSNWLSDIQICCSQKPVICPPVQRNCFSDLQPCCSSIHSGAARNLSTCSTSF